MLFTLWIAVVQKGLKPYWDLHKLLVAAGGTFREVWSKSPTHIHTFHVIGVIVQAFERKHA